MTEDVLKNISNRLNNTIKQTNELFKAINAKGTLDFDTSALTGGAKLKIIDGFNSPDKKWALPYTLPVTKSPGNEVIKEVPSAVVLPNRPSGRGPKESFEQAKGELEHDFVQADPKLEGKLEGWNEKQKKVFFKFVADSENKMRMESLRLQDEYNKQLASKLAMVRNELYESNRSNLMELQRMRLEKDRWSLEESETKNALSSVSTALEGLQKAYDNLRGELEDREFQLNSMDGELLNYERLVDTLRSDNASLQKELHDKSEHVTRLQNDVSDAYLRLEAESGKCSSAESELESVKQARKELMQQNKSLRVQLDSLALKNKFLVAERETLESRNAKLERELIELNKEAVGLQTRLRNFEVSESSKVSALQERVDSLTQKLKEAQVDLVALDKRAEVEGLNRQVQTLKAQLKQANSDNDALFKENATLQKKWDQEKALVKEHLNNLYEAKCRAHSLRSEVRSLKESLAWASRHLNSHSAASFSPPSSDPGAPDSAEVDLSFLKEALADKGAADSVKRRDLFAPTMFDCPDPETQAKIDELEKALTELHLEKDRLESEMTRCKLGPGSPTMQRRQHFLLERKVSETVRKINDVSGEIKTLYNN
ncbi:uncharacterized protein TOT_010000237 [Theileria orientalis strain Shintoku]|uniref:Uncharacterized protein n=1 Tax=Theileria orientalis strain Shintoku TaxID=869250 RepID=J7M4M0_THEOR|nr:uncharacterized protein TOT_010000237 [Theileria orientalis strain Shintoku]PVC52304.1 hypothetical protein MACL_00000908 [Theileria orientalis]BAM38770.1 uncharacterized protein TOT_010000237 [Theileria orientalis strain Shintoku]|eukprot:XP_009689071.1 uncharacterized protein TOT_010000237 [Theileria orientalis strain Shintoku]